MTASDTTSYHRTHDRDVSALLDKEERAQERFTRLERRLRIVEALAPDFSEDVRGLQHDGITGMANHYRLIVDALESLIEPTEGQPQ